MSQNPARLAPRLVELLPAAEVAAAELDRPPEVQLLYAEEARAVEHCAAKRIQDFAAGRLCARRALECLGIRDFALVPAASREPSWPPGIVGSITHTDGYAAAVVARATQIHGLGVDSERVASVHADLWPHIFTVREQELLRKSASSLAAAAAFAAKEAFYKSQYALTGEWVEFHDVVIELSEQADEAGAFEVLPQRRLQISQQYGGALRGRYRGHGPFVTAAMALPVV